MFNKETLVTTLIEVQRQIPGMIVLQRKIPFMWSIKVLEDEIEKYRSMIPKPEIAIIKPKSLETFQEEKKKESVIIKEPQPEIKKQNLA